MIMCPMRCRVISALSTVCLKRRWKSLGSKKPAVYWAKSFSQLGSGMLAGLIFLFQLAMQFCFFVVLLEKSQVIVRTVILSKGMRVSSNGNSSGNGYALIVGPV